MSLEFNSKLNKPGLSGSFGKKKTTGVSSQAARNLVNGTTANKTSLFSLKGTRKNNFVAGQSYKTNINKYNYQSMRASLNSRSYTPSVSSDYPSYGYNIPNQISINSGNNAYTKGQVIGQIVNGTFSMLNQLGIFDGLKSGGTVNRTASQTLDSAMNSLTGGSISSSASNVSGVISSMESATDSASLRAAIGEARGQLTTMDGLSAAYSDMRADAEGKVSGFESNLETSKKDERKAKNDLGTANQNVKASTANRDNALNAVSKADAEYGKAVEAYTQAHDAHTTAKTNHSNAQAATSRAQTSYNQAEATLNSTPETIQDSFGNTVHNPAYDQAKAAFENAKAQLEQAKQAEEKAKAELDKAAEAEQSAEKAKAEAYNNLGDKKEAVDAAENKLKTAQKGLDTAKEKQGQAQDAMNIAQENVQKATTILDSTEGIIEKCKAHANNVKILQKSIEKQEERLARLEEKEQDKYDKYDNKAEKGITRNNNRMNSIDGDVDTFREKMTTRRMERTNSRVASNLEKRNQYASNVTDTQYIQEQAKNGKADFMVGGQKYQKLTTPSGSEVYCRDGKVISEEEYNIGRKQAGLGS